MHARTHIHPHIHTHTHTHTHTAEPYRLALCDGSVTPNRDGPFRWRQWASLLHSNKNTRGRSGFPRFCVFFAYKKLLGRTGTETWTFDRMCFQTIRTVWDITLPRRSSKNCDLQFANFDRLKENYSIDICPFHLHYCWYNHLLGVIEIA